MRSFIHLIALLTLGIALQPAAAQSVQPSNTANPWKTEVVAAAPQTAPAPIGIALTSGWTLLPLAFSELGYDSNPDLSVANAKGSGFLRTGAGFNLSFASQGMATSFSASGSMLDYLNGDAVDELVRYAGSAKANGSYLLQPNMTVSSSAFIDYDGQSANKNQTSGANAELTYRDDVFASTTRVRFFDIQYLNRDANSPISPGATYDYNRSEVTWVGLLTKNCCVNPYAEVSVARVDYTDQPVPAILDRSADDYHAKGGLRMVLSPTLTADLGWRLNWRDTDDTRVSSFQSNFVDGSLSWKPSTSFLFSASVERYIGEPSTFPAVLSDVHSYSVKAAYQPVTGVTINAAGGWQTVDDIGSGAHYHVSFADARVGWDYNAHVQLYTALHYQNYEMDAQEAHYSDFRVLAGLRVIPDGQNLLSGESLDSLLARLADSSRPVNSQLTASGGYSWFGLPDLKMVTSVGGPWFNQSLGQETNGEGSLNGWRTDAGLANFANGVLPGGQPVSFGMSGFYAGYGGTTHSRCMYSLSTDCAIVNIADLSSSMPDNTGPFGNLNVTTRRDVSYYGLAVDGRFGSEAAGGLMDGVLAQGALPFKLGLAVRGLNETANLTSVDPMVSLPVTYKENLDTLYTGAFVGIEENSALGEGWMMSLDAKAGLYYANTEYRGSYNGYSFLFPTGYFQETGTVNSSLDRGSFIGTVRFDLKRQLPWGMVGAFAQGEYLSYVPRMVYNNNDQADGVLWGGIAGSQAGTRIASEGALNFTTGLNISIPVN